MAEFVEYRAEEWIAELDHLERIRLFETKEIKSIATKRKEFEYKIQRRTKCKEDFLKYIQFEIDLLRIIKARRKKTGIKTKKAEIDYSQTHRIGNLFKQVIFKFQDDVKLWMSFFKFCKDFKFLSLVSQMLVRMLQIHANKADLWVFAAKWEFQQCKSVDNARQFLTTGLRHHPSSDLLFKELFKLELEHMKRKKRETEKKKEENKGFQPDEITNSIIKGKVVEVIYESAIKAIQGVDFKVSLFDISVDKKAPVILQAKIFRNIVKNHLNEELTWNAIAKRVFRGFQCDFNQLIGEEDKMEVDEEKKKENISMKDRIQRTVNVYEEAVKRINSVKMWSFYLDFALELNKNTKKTLPVFKAKVLSNAIQGAMVSGNMAEKYYLEWINQLQTSGKKKKLSEVLKKATENYPKNVQLWYSHLKFYLSLDQEQKGMEVFDEAIKYLPDAASLWSLAVKYLQLKSSAKVEEVLKKGIKQGGEVAQTLKPLYIEWVAEAKGIEEARRVFESAEMNLYSCLKLYQKMADLESSRSPVCAEKVRKCHELACTNFGRKNSSVWLEYIRFELSKGDFSKIALIHKRALKALTPEQADEFISEFNNFKIKNSL